MFFIINAILTQIEPLSGLPVRVTDTVIILFTYLYVIRSAGHVLNLKRLRLILKFHSQTYQGYYDVHDIFPETFRDILKDHIVLPCIKFQVRRINVVNGLDIANCRMSNPKKWQCPLSLFV